MAEENGEPVQDPSPQFPLHAPSRHGRLYEALKYRPVEDPQERAVRLRKETLDFYVKDLLIWIVGYLVVIVTGMYCFWVLIRVDSTPADKDRAWFTVMTILGGIVGFLFGKAAR